MEKSGSTSERGVSDALRAAVQRTLAITADSAADTRGRAQDLLDEVARRGQGARDASSSITSRLVDAFQEMRLPTAEEIRKLRAQIEALDSRIADLERKLDAQPKVEGK